MTPDELDRWMDTTEGKDWRMRNISPVFVMSCDGLFATIKEDPRTINLDAFWRCNSKAKRAYTWEFFAPDLGVFITETVPYVPGGAHP